MTQQSEADALRDEWTRLRAAGAELAAETARLEKSYDAEALQFHNARLQAHTDKLQALLKRIDDYHHKHGPIGGLD